jgi:hypothetical protein
MVDSVEIAASIVAEMNIAEPRTSYDAGEERLSHGRDGMTE